MVAMRDLLSQEFTMEDQESKKIPSITFNVDVNDKQFWKDLH